jgi:hypothetical protein
LFFLALFVKPSSSHFFENVNFLAISLIFGVVFIAIVCGYCILWLSWQLLRLMNDLILRNTEQVGVFNRINLVLEDNFRDLFHRIAVHLAQMVFYFEFR